jgi:Tfp pilus assembly protein PilF
LVRPISLPDRYVRVGYTPSIFTENIIASLQTQIRNGQNGGIVRAVLPIHGATQKNTTCVDRTQVDQLMRELLTGFPMPGKIEFRPLTPAGEDLYGWIENTTMSILRLLGRTGATISADIRETETGLVLEGNAKFPSGMVYRFQAGSSTLEGIEKKALDQLTKVGTPWLYAALMFMDDPDGANEAVDIILTEFPRFADYSRLYALQGFAALNRQKHSTLITNAVEANDKFKQALESDPNNYLALVGSAVSYLRANNQMLYRAGKFDDGSVIDDNLFMKKTSNNLSLGDVKDLDDLRLNALKQVKRAIEIQPNNPIAHVLLASFLFAHGNDQEADKHRQLYLDNSPSRGQAFLELANLYLALRRPDLAEREIHQASNESAAGNSDFQATLLGTQARLYASIESWGLYDTTAKQLEKLNAPCDQYSVALQIQHRGSKKSDRPTSKSDLELAHHFYLIAEESGMSGFHFYNSWGVLLSELGKKELAIKKFSHALEFYGDHNWTLLNWGHMLIRSRDYQEAEGKFLESIKLGMVPSAVTGYLGSLFFQQKHSEFIEAYELYGRRIDLTGLSLIAGIAYCSKERVDEAKHLLGQVQLEWGNYMAVQGLKSCIRQHHKKMSH